MREMLSPQLGAGTHRIGACERHPRHLIGGGRLKGRAQLGGVRHGARHMHRRIQHVRGGLTPLPGKLTQRPREPGAFSCCAGEQNARGAH